TTEGATDFFPASGRKQQCGSGTQARSRDEHTYATELLVFDSLALVTSSHCHSPIPPAILRPITHPQKTPIPPPARPFRIQRIFQQLVASWRCSTTMHGEVSSPTWIEPP